MRLVFHNNGFTVDIPYETATVYAEECRGNEYRIIARDSYGAKVAEPYDSLEKARRAMWLIRSAYEMNKKIFKIPKNDEVKI